MEEVVIFDNSPYSEHGLSYAYIGLGPAPRNGQEALLDTYVNKNAVDSTEEDDSFKGSADSFETSLFKGDLFDIPAPSAEQVEMDNYQAKEQIKIEKELER